MLLKFDHLHSFDSGLIFFSHFQLAIIKVPSNRKKVKSEQMLNFEMTQYMCSLSQSLLLSSLINLESSYYNIVLNNIIKCFGVERYIAMKIYLDYDQLL